MATTKKERLHEAIEKHGRQLLAIFPMATEQDPIELCRRLRRLESKGAALGLRLCNGPEFADEDEADRIGDAILAQVDKILRYTESKVPVFLNRDPRGYALKINDAWMSKNLGKRLQRDWGGYGIIAPDLSENR